MRQNTVLQVRDLAVEFYLPGGSVRAVDGVEFKLTEGEVLSIIGESGSGKSATLQSIAGLLPLTATIQGTIRLNGSEQNLASRNADRRGIAGSEIGMIFQNPAASLNPVLTVGSQLDEVVGVHHKLRGRARRPVSLELMQRVGISDAVRRAAAYPHELSGGLKQRIAIAAALAGQPRLILADEPTTALDATVQAQILDLLLGLMDEEQVSMVFVTHDLAVAGAISDRIAVMRGGRILEIGPAQVIVNHPEHEYTATLANVSLPLSTHVVSTSCSNGFQ